MRNLPPLTLVTSDDEPPLLPALSSPFGLASGLGGIFSEIVGCQTERSVIRKNAYLLVSSTNFWAGNSGVSFLGNSVSSSIVDMKILGFFQLGCCFRSWLRSSLWLQFKPYQIAAGAAYLASKFLNMDFSSHHSVWKEFQTSPSVLRDVAQQLMELF
ncbi:hypothetical protein HAX54_020732 [Datura stramonium]|uniref:Uncharacterized protein n=1 Tax=Datura stramonium TaxID=4076 RepID=A0ABS8RK22_DATST|nr:hypothetical protein [Datura stramonium]